MWSASNLAVFPFHGYRRSWLPFLQLSDWGASSRTWTTDFTMKNKCTNHYATYALWLTSGAYQIPDCYGVKNFTFIFNHVVLEISAICLFWIHTGADWNLTYHLSGLVMPWNVIYAAGRYALKCYICNVSVMPWNVISGNRGYIEWAMKNQPMHRVQWDITDYLYMVI